MAQDTGDKTEAPTQRRREEAREEGNVARSADLTAAALLLGALVMLQWYGGSLLVAMHAVAQRMLGSESLAAGKGGATDGVVAAVLQIARAAAPLFAGVMLIAIIVNIAQVGLHLNLKKLRPDLGALSPMRGLGRLFKGQGPMQLVMGVLKMTLVAVAAYSA